MEKERYRIKNTLGMFDLLKGCMMILMILAHTYGLFDIMNGYESYGEFIAAQNPIVLVLLLLFMLVGEASMPILFIASGYGFRKTTFKKCVEKQAKMLLYPYAVTGCVAVVVHFVYYYLRYRSGLRTAVVQTIRLLAGFMLGLPNEATILGQKIGICGPVWFLLALFIGNVIFNELLQRFEGKALLLVSVLISCVGWALSLLNISPWAISQSLVAVLYICFGHMIKKNKIYTSNEKPVLRIVTMVLILAAHLIMRCFGEYNMAVSIYTFGPISIIICGLSACLTTYLFLFLNRFKGGISEFIRKIGRLSLYVLCVHTVEIMGMGVYAQYDFVNNFAGNHYVASWTVFGVRTVLVIGGTFLFVWAKDLVTNTLKKKETAN